MVRLQVASDRLFVWYCVFSRKLTPSNSNVPELKPSVPVPCQRISHGNLQHTFVKLLCGVGVLEARSSSFLWIKLMGTKFAGPYAIVGQHRAMSIE
jgi:hypothetical protein